MTGLRMRLLLPLLAAALFVSHAAHANGWLSVKRHDGIAYFLFESPPSVERYALAQRTWLASIELADAPTAFVPGESGLFIAYGESVVRRELDGSDETPLITTGNTVNHLATDGNILFVQSGSATMTAVNAATGAVLDSRGFNTTTEDLVVAPGLRRLYMRGSAGSRRLEYAEYSSEGIISEPVSWPHSGDELRADAPLFLKADETLLFDRTGSAFDTNTLAFVGSLGNVQTALDAYGDGYAILQNQLLYLYGPDLLAHGRLILPELAHALFVDGNDALTFSRGDGTAMGISVNAIDLTAIGPLDLEFLDNDTVGPQSFLRDGAIDVDGTLFLAFGGGGNLFRLFDTLTQQYFSTFQSPIGAYMMRMDTAARRLYGATLEGSVFYFDLDEPTRVHSLFNVPYTIGDIIQVDDFWFANTLLGFSNPSYRTYDSDGNPIDARSSGNIVSQYHIWEPGRRRVYHLREHFLPADLMYTIVEEDGTIGATVGSGAPADGATFPIRVSPDGEYILLGSGRIHLADGLEVDGSLPNPIVDAVWLDDVPFTLANIDETAQVQRWLGEKFDADGMLALPGTALGMMSHGGNLVVATQDDDGHHITIVSPELAVIPPPVPLNPADINADGFVNALDVQLVINAALGVEIEHDADVNGDGLVNAVDVQLVINAALGLDG